MSSSHSKSFILQQIKNILIKKHDYTEEAAESYIESNREKKAYELLVLKRDLKRGPEDDEEENEDVSISTRLKN
jgi:hypothetical protein